MVKPRHQTPQRQSFANLGTPLSIILVEHISTICHEGVQRKHVQYNIHIECLGAELSSEVRNWYIDGILPKETYPPCLRMANRALLAGYPRYVPGAPFTKWYYVVSQDLWSLCIYRGFVFSKVSSDIWDWISIGILVFILDDKPLLQLGYGWKIVSRFNLLW